MARLAWFSPMPPVATGIAVCSAALVKALAAQHEIDVFVDEPVVSLSPGARSAHDFVWLRRLRPYDLVVHQLGNSSHHDYQWPYLFRYPGLTVLHDAHLHHARAASLLRNDRADDYRTEFARNHADANIDLAELAIAGFDSHLHYAWPMTRLVVNASRLVAVHSLAIAERLRENAPSARIEIIRLGHGRLLPEADEASLRARTRARYGIPADAIVFGCYGGLTPDKRLPQILAAFAATRAYVPSIHLLLAGAIPAHYSLGANVERHGLQDCTTVTGYLASDDEFTGAVAACDAALNLRWPTARELSGPWLHCLAAGKPTVIADLAHLVDVPTVDPRTWQPNTPWPGRAVPAGDPEPPCAVAIDILDEDHSLRLAMRRLALDASFRTTLGRAARQYWSVNHSIEGMVADYQRAIAEAAAIGRTTSPTSPAEGHQLPAHLVAAGANKLEGLIRRFGLEAPFQL